MLATSYNIDVLAYIQCSLHVKLKAMHSMQSADFKDKKLSCLNEHECPTQHCIYQFSCPVLISSVEFSHSLCNVSLLSLRFL